MSASCEIANVHDSFFFFFVSIRVTADPVVDSCKTSVRQQVTVLQYRILVFNNLDYCIHTNRKKALNVSVCECDTPARARAVNEILRVALNSVFWRLP